MSESGICRDCFYRVVGTNECRRFPPQLVAENRGWLISNRWPQIKEIDWCGEFLFYKREE